MRMSNQEAADKQAWSLLPTRESALHACLLHPFTQDSLIYIHVSIQVSGLETFGHAGCWRTGDSLRGIWIQCYASSCLGFVGPHFHIL